jgi:hypothetical protein
MMKSRKASNCYRRIIQRPSPQVKPATRLESIQERAGQHGPWRSRQRLSWLTKLVTSLGVPHRPSIIRPPPGRYVKVGIEDGLCSFFSLARPASCGSSGRSIGALQPTSALKVKSKMADLNRSIAFLLFTPAFWDNYSRTL